MAAGGGVGEEARERLRASLKQGWTILQDVDEEGGDREWKIGLGVEVDEEVEDGVLYISLKEPVSAEDRVVVGELKPGKERVQRSDVSFEWVSTAHLQFSCTAPDEAVELVTLKLQPYYRREGPDRYAVKVELLDILWDGKLEKNQRNARGFFVDMVTIRLTAQWESDDRCPVSFSPPTPNDPISFQSSTQMGVQVGAIGQNRTAALTYNKTTSQGFSSRPWVAKWERSSAADNIGSATLKLRLNMLCSGRSGMGKFIPYNIEHPEKGNWALGGDVPQLPPSYDGSFSGWFGKDAPSAGWSVHSSTFQDQKVCWKPEISLRISKLTAQAGAGVFKSQRRWDKRTVSIKPDGPGLLGCLPADQWVYTFKLDSFSTSTGIIVALLVAVLAAATGALWQLHGN